jgi:hypothetical protein
MNKNSKNQGVDLRHSYISFSGKDMLCMIGVLAVWLIFLSINIYFI